MPAPSAYRSGVTMEAMTLKELARKGSNAVRLLRKTRLNEGLPFMINSSDLDDAACYLEYPDGTIQLVEQSSDGTDFKLLKTLSSVEATYFPEDIGEIFDGDKLYLKKRPQ